MKGKELLNISCPVCGGKLYGKDGVYRCEGKKEGVSACHFLIQPIAGKQLSTQQVEDLIAKGQTPMFHDFISKSGKPFEAGLKLTIHKEKNVTESNISFVFPEITEDVS